MPITNGNLGVGALATSTIYLVNQVAEKNGWSINYLHLGRTTGVDVAEIDGKRVEIKNVLYNRFDYPKGFLWHCMHPKYFLSELKLKKADYLLDITGGDSYSDIYGQSRFYHNNLIKKMFRYYHIPQMMLPQTVGPFEDKKVKEEARKSVEETDVVLTRDRMSYDWVKENTQQKNVHELIDVAFFMPYSPLQFDSQRIHVGLNVSSLLWHGGYTRNNQFGLKVDYQKLVHTLLDSLLKLDNVVVHLVPHVIGTDAGGVENDYWIATRLQQQYNTENLVVAPYFFSPIEAKNYISGLDFFAGARMHSCIAAFSSGVPVVPMSYSRKFNGLFAETLSYPYMVDMKTEESDAIIEKVIEAVKNRRDLKSAIKSQDQLLADRKALILEQIEKFLSK